MNWRRLMALTCVLAFVALASFAPGLWVLASDPPEAPSPSLTVTRAQDGKTVVLRVNDRFLLQLGEEFNWTVAVSDPTIVRRISDVLVVRGAQGIYEAEQVGETEVTATGVLNCAPSQICPQLAALFRVHISVGSELKYRTTLSQLARDGVDGRDRAK